MSKTDLVLILFLHNCGPYPVPTNVCDAAILLEHLLHAVNAVSANSLDNCQVFYWTKSMENEETDSCQEEDIRPLLHFL